MFRRYLCATLVIAVLVGSGLAWAFTRSSADQPHEAEIGGIGKASEPLPISQLVLFNTGVGYIQREGEISGDATVDLTFPTRDVNDLLKSLVLQDGGGGRIGAIHYDSHDPIDKILHSFALDLNNNPSFGQILSQARGEKIEVQRQEKPGANPYKVAGTIIGMEARTEAAGKGQAVVVEQVNLLTAEGMIGIPLAQVLSVRFLNPALEAEFHRALQVLAGAHDMQKKAVALHFSGNGKRPVRVGYVVEHPIWKTTYRLTLDPNGKLFIQGWAIVENTSDDDWNNVRMVLVSGKPISFRMDLYAPLYVPRPLVEPELFASLRPPVYGGALGNRKRKEEEEEEEARVPSLAGVQAQQLAPGALGKAITFQRQSSAEVQRGLSGGDGSIGSSLGLGGTPGQFIGSGGPSDGTLPGFYFNQTGPVGTQGIASQGANKADADRRLSYEELLKRRAQIAAALADAKKTGSAVAGLNFKEGVQSVASASEVGEYYQYVIEQKVNLPRQKSAMLPIVNQTIAGEKVSIYNESVQARFPLLGIRLKNTSGKSLTQGPITVYEEGSYAGDTRTLDLQPNEERLLSYALDQSTEVKTTSKASPAPEMTLKIGSDSLSATYTMRDSKTYTLKNRGSHDRTVLIEHPIRSDWKLIEPKQAKEQTRDVYRFEIAVKAGETVEHVVTEEQTRTDPLVATQGGAAQPRYAITGGIEVKSVAEPIKPELVSLRIANGILQKVYKARASKTYVFQNQSTSDYVFTVDHIVRESWKRIDNDNHEQVGPDVFRFQVKVKAKKSGRQEVVEEQVVEGDKWSLAACTPDVLRETLAQAVGTAKVKEILGQVLEKKVKLRDLELKQIDALGALKVLSEDQARIRENLKIVPQTSDAYKDFLKKFVAQESQIEDAQRSIRADEAQLGRLRNEFEKFVADLKAG
jgi:hypothetical protein